MDHLDPGLDGASSEAFDLSVKRDQQLSSSPEPPDRRHLFFPASTTTTTTTSAAVSTSNNSNQESASKTQDARDFSLHSAVALQKEDVPSAGEDNLKAAEENQDIAVAESMDGSKPEAAPPVAPRAKKRNAKPRPSSTTSNDSPETTIERLKWSVSLQRRSVGIPLVPDDGKDGIYLTIEVAS